MIFDFDVRDNTVTYSYDNYNYYYYYYRYQVINEDLIKINEKIDTTCQNCEEGYYLNEAGQCEILTTDKCLGKFFIKNINITYNINDCINLCERNYYPYIYLGLINNKIVLNKDNNFNNSDITSISDLINDILNTYRDFNFDKYDNETQNYIFNSPLCYNLYNDNLRNSYHGCEKVIYFPKENTFECFGCKNGYNSDKEKKICHKIVENIFNSDCEKENIGTEKSPLYSCIKCFDQKKSLVKIENGVNICVDDPTLENCLEINSDSYYLKPDYNCTNCTMNYIPFYMKYYQKQICQNIYEKITKKAEIDMDIFKYEESKNINNDGNCDKNFFTTEGNN